MKISLLVTACLGCFAAAAVNAQPPAYYPPAMGYGHVIPQHKPVTRMPQRQKKASDVEEAGIILKAGLNKLLGFFNSPRPPSREKIAEFLDKEIAPYFDFAYMAKWSAGSTYRRLSEQQKKKMESELRTQFLTTMAQKLSSFNQQSVRYLAPRITGRNQVELSIAISNAGSYPARLDFRLYKSGNGWKVYDVSANGSSALMYYRQYFRQKVQRQMQRQARPAPPVHFTR